MSAEAKAVLSWPQTLDEQTLFVSPSASSTGLDQYDNFYSLQLSNNYQVETMCTFLAEQFDNGLQEVLVVYRNDEHGTDLASELQTVCAEYEINVNIVTSYETNSIGLASDI